MSCDSELAYRPDQTRPDQTTNKPKRSQTAVLLISYNSPCSHPRRCRGGPSGRLEQVLYFWPEFWLLFRVTPTHNKKKNKIKQAFFKFVTNLDKKHSVYLSQRS